MGGKGDRERVRGKGMGRGKRGKGDVEGRDKGWDGDNLAIFL